MKPPVFLTSTFVFGSAEEGRDFFDYVAGRKTPPAGRAAGLVYSRFNHPNSEIVEDRLAVYEGAETCAPPPACRRSPRRCWPSRGPATWCCIRSRSMAARKRCWRKHCRASAFPPSAVDGVSEAAIRTAVAQARSKGRISVIMVETPANPTNTLVDIALLRRFADEIGAAQGTPAPMLVCDNTLLGPLFQRPLYHGADVSVYSLTKYVGGHSDPGRRRGYAAFLFCLLA